MAAKVISNTRQDIDLNQKEMKRLLTVMGVTWLITLAGLSMNGCAIPWGGKKQIDAGSIKMEQSTTASEVPLKNMSAPAVKPDC